uniref:CYRIA/CYRIB Rac1 binding domain-containing protein n=1 Tax=Entamoeba invadens TaxID=33085 RepID=S0B471_ENTIV|nr:hypothetical protein, conserved [Entamoeba invadens]
MGQILALFRGGASGDEIIIDFENVNPTEPELPVWNAIDALLKKKDDVLKQIFSYTGKDDLIRAAISSRTPDEEVNGLTKVEEEAWQAISGQADIVHEFYQFACSLENEFPKLITELSNTEPKITLMNKQALCKQLGLILDFVLAFDNKKVTTPGIQNDFSYYRRNSQRMKQFKRENELKIPEETQGRISMFIASPSPMMNHLINIVKTVQGGTTNPAFGEVLTTFANVCNDMVEKQIFSNNEMNLFCLRVMTGCIILNDRISELTSFHKKTPVKIKDCIMQLKNFGDNPQYAEQINSLLDTFRYTCLHVNDPETPGFIKALLI